MENEKRLFFGMEVKAPWPDTFPYGRLLDENHRHLTLAFLGMADFQKLQKALSTFPPPPFKVGFAAKFDQCLFLPPKHPHVIAWHIEWRDKNCKIQAFYETLVKWLQQNDFAPDTRHGFLPHVTMARAPFNAHVWRKKFSPLPVIIKDLHLYESLGHSKYTPLWSYSLLPPFEEIEHTADVAYKIWGETYDQLYQHAGLALAFSFPSMLEYIHHKEGFHNLEDVIMELNHLVTLADQEIGCPFKAVSYHSKLESHDNLLLWEMIIDV